MEKTFDLTKKYRGYFLTINNFTPDEEGTLKSDSWLYCIYQVEQGSEGTEHIQAFIYYQNPRVWPKRKYPRAHIEPAKSFEASIKYCSKENTRIRGPYEFGVKPEQGRRTDLESLGERVIKGEDLKNIAYEAPAMYCRYFKGLQALQNITKQNRTEKPTNIWIWGKAGAGKTRWVFDKHGETNVFVKDGTQWWDGYTGQEAIVIDDFDGKWPYRDLLRLLDRYPYQGQIKGGYVKINSPFIYFTCEFPPEKIYGNNNFDLSTGLKDDNHLDQILRRLDEINEFRTDRSKLKMPVRKVIEN